MFQLVVGDELEIRDNKEETVTEAAARNCNQ